MILVVRQLVEPHPLVFDAINADGVEDAWFSTVGGTVTSTTRRRVLVHLSFQGTPPEDEQVLRIVGLRPDEHGIVFVPYQEETQARRYASRRYGKGVVPAHDARWGILARRFTEPWMSP